MKSVGASTLLRRLEALKTVHGGEAAAAKSELLRGLAGRRLSRSGEVSRLHEVLCFLRAYPDDAGVLAQVEALLEGFDRRPDLRQNRAELDDTGIAGTAIHFSFFWPTARWLARRYPDRLAIDWKAFDRLDRLDELFHLLVPYAETPGLDMLDFGAREWVDHLRGPDVTDATFLIRRFEALAGDEFVREYLFESLDLPFRLFPTPSRTLARYRPAPIVFQDRPLVRKRPSLRREMDLPPVSVRKVPPREGSRLIGVVREAMVDRHRDLYGFTHANPRDVCLVDCGGGLQFACIGLLPERRLVLETLYGFLTLKNGVPIGYVLASSLLGSTETAYNVFESFRGGEAAQVFGRVLGMIRHLFGSDSFSIDPYQLGYDNSEGLESGAWWFYYKLGFRPLDPAVRRLARRELARIKRDPRHRSDAATLRRLASEHLFLHRGPAREENLVTVPLAYVGLQVTRYLSRRFGSDRETGIKTCMREARALLGVRSRGRLQQGERLAWERFSPIVMILPGIARWKASDKLDLVRVIRAKGAESEADFVRLFDGHRKLRRAIVRLAEGA